MRIGFDVSATCNEKTGCTWYADSLIRAMVRRHPRHSYILYHQFGRLCQEHASQGTTVHAENVSQPYFETPVEDANREWSEIEGGLTPAGEPDIIQANFFNCPRIETSPVVFVVHDFAFWVCPEFLTSGHLMECTRGICEAICNASGMIFNSDHTRQEFERIFPGWLKRKAIPSRVTHFAARGAEAGASVDPVFGRDYWLFVGSMEPRKNIVTLLQAHDAYWERSPSPRKLVLAGGRGWCSEHIHREIAVREKLGRVRYTGYVPEAQMEALYAHAFAVVYPSYYEGFGLPILEALSRGVPVICSRATSHPEVGGDAVAYFDPWSPAELAERMLDLERNGEKRERLATAGKQRAEQFSWERVADETIGFYDEVIDSWRKKRASPS